MAVGVIGVLVGFGEGDAVEVSGGIGVFDGVDEGVNVSVGGGVFDAVCVTVGGGEVFVGGIGEGVGVVVGVGVGVQVITGPAFAFRLSWQPLVKSIITPKSLFTTPGKGKLPPQSPSKSNAQL